MPRHTPLSITFRAELDHRAIEQGLTIDPPISGTLKWQGRTLVFTPDRGWQPDRMYRITVKYRDQILPPSWTFTTRPLITSISPRDTRQANWNDPIQITFSEAMDHASVEAAFSIIPADARHVSVGRQHPDVHATDRMGRGDGIT